MTKKYDIMSLSHEISVDPKNIGYDTSSPTGVEKLINAKTIIGKSTPVPLIEIKRHALIHGYWSSIKLAADDRYLSPTVKGACIAAVDFIEDDRFDVIDLSLPVVQHMLGAILGARFVRKEHFDDLLRLGCEFISRAEQIWGQGTIVLLEDIIKAIDEIGS